jgi:gluconolactonase
VSPYLENTNGANGLAFNGAGETIAVQTTKPGIAVLSPAGEVIGVVRARGLPAK